MSNSEELEKNISKTPKVVKYVVPDNAPEFTADVTGWYSVDVKATHTKYTTPEPDRLFAYLPYWVYDYVKAIWDITDEQMEKAGYYRVKKLEEE